MKKRDEFVSFFLFWAFLAGFIKKKVYKLSFLVYNISRLVNSSFELTIDFFKTFFKEVGLSHFFIYINK